MLVSYDSLPPYTTYLFTNHLGWQRVEAELLIKEVREELKNPRIHMYVCRKFLVHQNLSLFECGHILTGCRLFSVALSLHRNLKVLKEFAVRIDTVEFRLVGWKPHTSSVHCSPILFGLVLGYLTTNIISTGECKTSYEDQFALKLRSKNDAPCVMIDGNHVSLYQAYGRVTGWSLHLLSAGESISARLPRHHPSSLTSL